MCTSATSVVLWVEVGFAVDECFHHLGVALQKIKIKIKLESEECSGVVVNDQTHRATRLSWVGVACCCRQPRSAAWPSAAPARSPPGCAALHSAMQSLQSFLPKKKC